MVCIYVKPESVIQIISGTHRKGSRSLQVAHILHNLYADLKLRSSVLDLQQLPPIEGQDYDSNGQPQALKQAFESVNTASALHIVVPEYNGSMPGVLKHFIDHWSYPQAFEWRPVALVGLGGRFGGLRPVEHLQGVLLYRNAFLYPRRVFLLNVEKALTADGQLSKYLDELKQQTQGFARYVQALQQAGLAASYENKL